MSEGARPSGEYLKRIEEEHEVFNGDECLGCARPDMEVKHPCGFLKLARALVKLRAAITAQADKVWWCSPEADKARARYIKDGPDRNLADVFLAVEEAERTLREVANGN